MPTQHRQPVDPAAEVMASETQRIGRRHKGTQAMPESFMIPTWTGGLS